MTNFPELLRDTLEKIRVDPETGKYEGIAIPQELLSLLVQQNTQSSFNPDECKTNAPFVLALQQCLNEAGCATWVDTDEFPEGSGILHATLVARMGPEKKAGDAPAGLLFSAHTDVVAVREEDKESWSAGEPFTLHNEDGHLTGRGAVDMKHAIANYLTIAQLYKNKHELLEKPVYLALSWGEELGCKGVPTVTRLLDSIQAKPDIIIVGEPTDEKLVAGHKGSANISLAMDTAGCAHAYVRKLENALDALQQKYKGAAWHDSNFDPPFPIVNIGTEFIASDHTTPADMHIDIKTIGGHSSTPDFWISARDYEKKLEDAIGQLAENYRQLTTDAPAISIGTVEIGSVPNAVPSGATVSIHITSDNIPRESIYGDISAIVHKLDRELKQAAIARAEMLKIRPPEEDTVSVTLTPGACTCPAVKSSATLGVHLRTTPKAPFEVIRQDIAAIVDTINNEIRASGGTGIVTGYLSQASPLPKQADTPALKMIQTVLRELGNDDVSTKTVGYAADAGGFAEHYAKDDLQPITIIYGTGSLAQNAHGIKEYITEEQLMRAPVFPLRMIAEYCLDKSKVMDQDAYPIPFAHVPVSPEKQLAL